MIRIKTDAKPFQIGAAATPLRFREAQGEVAAAPGKISSEEGTKPFPCTLPSAGAPTTRVQSKDHVHLRRRIRSEHDFSRKFRKPCLQIRGCYLIQQYKIPALATVE